ncbi:MAG: hypothetical protein K8I60_22270 [Anaerolineae bacterium]|nr:hypothetical protein [Anaerolineae bacterium]
MLSRFAPGRLTLILILIALAVAISGAVISYNSFVPGTDIDTYKLQLGAFGPASAASTIFSAALLVICAILTARITLARQRGCLTIHWAGLVIVFLLLAFEKLTNANEVFFDSFRAWISQIDYFRDNWYWYTTAMFAGLFGLAFVIVYLPFLIHLNWRARLLFALGGILFVLGSFGIDLGSTYFIQDRRYQEVTQQTVLIMALLGGAEIFVEMLSSITFLYALWRFGVDKGFWGRQGETTA